MNDHNLPILLPDLFRHPEATRLIDEADVAWLDWWLLQHEAFGGRVKDMLREPDTYGIWIQDCNTLDSEDVAWLFHDALFAPRIRFRCGIASGGVHLGTAIRAFQIELKINFSDDTGEEWKASQNDGPWCIAFDNPALAVARCCLHVLVEEARENGADNRDAFEKQGFKPSSLEEQELNLEDNLRRIRFDY